MRLPDYHTYRSQARRRHRVRMAVLIGLLAAAVAFVLTACASPTAPRTLFVKWDSVSYHITSATASTTARLTIVGARGQTITYDAPGPYGTRRTIVPTSDSIDVLTVWTAAVAPAPDYARLLRASTALFDIQAGLFVTLSP